jgi:predicted Zn finger-like uncharacterized protein
LIVTCEACETRFRLDESRLPAKGARVRCSRCKHAFFVRPEGAPASKAIHELAEQAATTARPSTPEPTWDLDEAPGRTIQKDPGRTMVSPRPAPAEPQPELDESDWRFEDEVPQLGDSGASLDLPNGEAPPPPLDANESSFAELGDPESWDLSSSASDRAPLATEPEPRAPAAVPAAPVAVEAPRVERPIAASAPAEEVISQALPEVGEPSFGLRAMAWTATLALAAWIALAAAVGGTREAPAPEDAVPLGAFAMEEISARLVDNAYAGPIWVVRGALRNASEAPRALSARVAVSLLDARGVPIEGAVATALPPLPDARLRESDPETLRADATQAALLAQRVLPPGEPVELEAVFDSAPSGAVRFSVETRALER